MICLRWVQNSFLVERKERNQSIVSSKYRVVHWSMTSNTNRYRPMGFERWKCLAGTKGGQLKCFGLVVLRTNGTCPNRSDWSQEKSLIVRLYSSKWVTKVRIRWKKILLANRYKRSFLDEMPKMEGSTCGNHSTAQQKKLKGRFTSRSDQGKGQRWGIS